MSLKYHIDVYNHDITKNTAYVQNELFPDQKIVLDPEIIQDCKAIMGRELGELVKEVLLIEYIAKYSN